MRHERRLDKAPDGGVPRPDITLYGRRGAMTGCEQLPGLRSRSRGPSRASHLQDVRAQPLRFVRFSIRRPASYS